MNSINNNLMAVNVSNNLNTHYGRLATSVERLSTGLRINSAADDAAGLAIRELMRVEVAAINQGVRNANDAISMLQVADGALSIIDEKLIRMKELAEQAATGTYDSTQRLMIHSEFVAMASEIDRIAHATDFNGIRLLDGSLSGVHNGKDLVATGAMKIHFGSSNDSAEDYYYVKISDCSIRGLGLEDDADTSANALRMDSNEDSATQTYAARAGRPPVNDYVYSITGPRFNLPATGLGTMQDIFRGQQGTWGSGLNAASVADNNFMFIIPAGSKNILINTTGGGSTPTTAPVDNDIQLFTRDGKHLAGTPQGDYVYDSTQFQFVTIPANYVNESTALADNCGKMGFTVSDYDASALNSGPGAYDGATLRYTTYNGMTIGYSGDADRHDNVPDDGKPDKWADYEILTLDEAREDLVVWLPGYMSASLKVYWDLPDEAIAPAPGPVTPPADVDPSGKPAGRGNGVISIATQEKAQKALVKIDDAIVAKDKVRAYLGAMQNRLENTIASLNIQSENLQAAESRISDVDVAREMTEFVRNQVLAQSSAAMLGQANSYPHMLATLING